MILTFVCVLQLASNVDQCWNQQCMIVKDSDKPTGALVMLTEGRAWLHFLNL